LGKKGQTTQGPSQRKNRKEREEKRKNTAILRGSLRKTNPVCDLRKSHQLRPTRNQKNGKGA